MRLCYLIPEFPGVTHVIFWREIRRLREVGLEVTVASTRRPARRAPDDFDGEPCTYAWPPTRALIAGVPGPRRLLRQLRFALSLPEGGWRERLTVLAMLPSSWMLAAYLRRHEIDQVHVQSFASAAYLATLAHVAGGVPYSLVLHGGLAVYGRNHVAKLSHARFACAVSPATRAEIEAIAPGKALNDDILCGVDLDIFRPGPRRPDGPLRLVSVGRINHCKGITLTLEAMARLVPRTELRYTLIGSGPHEAAIMGDVTRLGLTEVVSFLGPMKQDAVAARLLKHDVAVLTSVGPGETTAIAIREAMATGMPVIMSRVGEAERMIEDGVDGMLVPEGDIEGISVAIGWYATHRDRIAAMGAAARARAEREFGDRVGPTRLLAAIRERDAAPDLGRRAVDAARPAPEGFRPPPSAAPPPPRPS